MKRFRPAADEDWIKRPVTARQFLLSVLLGVTLLMFGYALDQTVPRICGLLIVMVAVVARFRTLLAQHRAEKGQG